MAFSPRAPLRLPRSVAFVRLPVSGDGSNAAAIALPDSRARMVFLRAIVWGLIGLVYAPLFLGLTGLLAGAGLGQWAYVAAAALAGGAGAVLYGGREVALLGTGIGVGIGFLALLASTPGIGFGEAAAGAALLAGAVAASPFFGARCTRHVPAKVMAGMTTGALVGTILAVAEPLHPRPFSAFAVLAFTVSVNGVLYVATVRPWVGLTQRMRLRARAWPCKLVEIITIAVLAGLAAGSVWVVAGSLFGESAGLVEAAGELIFAHLPLASLGGIFGGALAGALLELFGFSWVHDA